MPLTRLPRVPRWVLRAAAALGLLWVALWVAIGFLPFPSVLRAGLPEPGLLVFDRHGRPIKLVAAQDGSRALTVRLKDVAPQLRSALLAAEDQRFESHPGLDPLALLRALGQCVANGRVVSGGSTITQQLARSTFQRPRSLVGKLRELALALRIERELSKDEILEQYLNRVAFGPNLRGVETASFAYFDKPASALDLAEAATLAAIPRGPSLYNPARHPERTLKRRNRILERMRKRQSAEPLAIQAALGRPLELKGPALAGGAEHVIRGLAGGALEGTLRQQPEGSRSLTKLHTTLDLELQQELQALVKQTVRRMRAHTGSAAALVLIENESGEVLAYVGSQGFGDEAGLGQNDGVRAKRQPGSTLKPFVYAAALEQLSFSAATLLPDVELHLPAQGFTYSPKNYDGLLHGPVRLRQALASSYNIPAVYTAQRVGPPRLLALLQRLGFASLDQPAEHYGAAIALGDGEVTLLELTAAYSVLARGGLFLPPRFAKGAVDKHGQRVESVAVASTRVLRSDTAALLSDMLSDDTARAAAFGPEGVLELPFPTAVKTGTSRAYRDNWTVGYTRELSLGVWVGNFDARPMIDSSGVTGAAPLFREAMLAAMRGRAPAPLVSRQGLQAVQICPLSGQRRGEACPQGQLEWFAKGSVQQSACDFHVHAEVDPENGLLAGPACKQREKRRFEEYPESYVAWARSAGRPLLPTESSPRCPLPGARGAVPPSTTPSIIYPFDGARFFLDHALIPGQQELVLRAQANSQEPLTFVLNEHALATAGPPFRVPWALKPGRHKLYVTAKGTRSSPVEFSVE